jgi:dihydroneopterin aldolase
VGAVGFSFSAVTERKGLPFSLFFLTFGQILIMGLIAVEGLQFYAHHGYHKEEQILGGKYTVDIYMTTNIDEAAKTDELKKTINYEQIYLLTKAEMEVHAKLIEHVCKRIIDRINARYPTVTHLKVRVSKHSPPLKGHVDRVFVELETSV